MESFYQAMGHDTRSKSRDHNPEDDGFTAEDRKSLIDLLSYAKRIDSKMKMIKDHVKKQNELIMQQNDVIATQSKQINDLIAQINCVNYRGDAQQQYNRREGVKARNVNGLGNDAFEIMKLEITLFTVLTLIHVAQK